MAEQQTLIFTDLDGTLLDHDNYQFDQALPVIKRLQADNIPIIFTTSKTLAEVLALQVQMHITAPVIIENGAAVFIPQGTFAQQPEGTETHENYWVKSFCLPRVHWLNMIEQTPVEFSGMYQGFSSMTVEQLIALTHLKQSDAELAQQRHFGEPMHWLDSPENKQKFIAHLQNLGATVLQGGRFFHVGGKTDKGVALTWLSQCYKKHYNNDNIRTIALGDGENDIAMLEAATVAVQIRSPVHNFPTLAKQVPCYQTRQMGPAGWAEALQHLLPTAQTLT